MAVIKLYNPQQAHKAIAELWPRVKAALMDGKRLELVIREETRSTEQNKRLWAMLGEVSAQVVWHGEKLSAEDWKHVFSASLKRQRAVHGIDGGFVVLGQSTRKMSVSEMSELQTLIEAFGAEHGVVFSGE